MAAARRRCCGTPVCAGGGGQKACPRALPSAKHSPGPPPASDKSYEPLGTPARDIRGGRAFDRRRAFDAAFARALRRAVEEQTAAAMREQLLALSAVLEDGEAVGGDEKEGRGGTKGVAAEETLGPDECASSDEG